MMARILKLLFLISLSFSIWTEHSVRLQIKKKFTVKKWMQHKVVFIMFVFSMQVFKVNYLRVTNLWTRHCMLYISDLWLRVEVKQVCLQVVDKMCNVHCTFQVIETSFEQVILLTTCNKLDGNTDQVSFSQFFFVFY